MPDDRPLLAFDAERHEYRVDGRRLPSVTELTAPLTDAFYRGIPSETLQAAADFGRAVHLACELDDCGDLDEATLDARLAPYLAAWRKFKADTRCTIELNEAPRYHRALGFAGTPDRGVILRGKYVLIDIKTVAAWGPHIDVQLAGYDVLLQDNGWVADQLGSVLLREDSGYRFHPVDPRERIDHRACFMGLLAVQNWKERYAQT